MKKLMMMMAGVLMACAMWAQNTPITNVEGDSFTYVRAGKCLYPKKYGDSNYIYEGNQGGSITIVFGKNKKVYLQDPVYGFAHQTYVEGVLSDDGKAVTVVLPQVLYVYDNGDKVLLAVGKFDADSKEYKIDQTVTEITYALDTNDVFTLTGCGKNAPLGDFWAEDGSFAGRGEWETVLTKYVEQTEVVEVTAEQQQRLETYDRPMEGAYWSGNGGYSMFTNNIKVAKLENTDSVLVQGLVPLLPEAWARGVKKDNTVTFPVQLLNVTSDGKKYFLAGVSGDRLSLAPFTMRYDDQLNSYAAEDRLLVNSSDINFSNETVWGYYTGVYVGDRPAKVTLPESVTADQIKDMPFEGVFDNGQKTQPVVGVASVVVDGPDVYIKGLLRGAPDSWLKGSFDILQEHVYIDLGQYVGYDAYGNIYVVGDKYDQKDFLNTLSESVDDPARVHLSYDAEKGTFKLENNLYASRKCDEIDRDNVTLAGLTINEGILWVASKQGYADSADLTELQFGGNVKGVLDKATGSNGPKYYTNGEAVRMYAGNTLTISSPEKAIGKIAFVFDTSKQPIMEALDGDFYIDGELGLWTGDDNEVSFNVSNGSGNQVRIKSILVFFFDYSQTTVELPDFVSVTPYEMRAKLDDGSSTNDITAEVLVGVDGNDIYIQGLSQTIPTAWVKGKISGDKVTIPGWLLGSYEKLFGGTSRLAFVETVMSLASGLDVISSDGYKVVDPDETMDIFADVEVLTEVTITKKTEVAAVPAAPAITDFVAIGNDRYVTIQVPTVDKDGSNLFTAKLGYVLFVEKSDGVTELALTKELYGFDTDLAEIPYDYTDGVTILRERISLLQSEDVMQTWKKIGIQSVYRGGNALNKSNISWYDLSDYWASLGVEMAGSGPISIELFDLQGRSVNTRVKGLFIKQIRHVDGAIKVIKVIRK